MKTATANRDEEIVWSTLRPRAKKSKPATAVAQTRLDRITDPPHTYFKSWLTWSNRFTQHPADWPSLDLKEYAEDELGPEIARQKDQLRQHPETWTGEDWVREHDRLLKMEGKMTAILEILGRRERAAKLGLPSTSATSSPGPATSTGTALEWDPFQNC